MGGGGGGGGEVKTGDIDREFGAEDNDPVGDVSYIRPEQLQQCHKMLPEYVEQDQRGQI